MRTLQPDYRKNNGEWSTGRQEGFTLGGSRWFDMCKRCKIGGRTQRLQPTYAGVTHSFESAHDFISWARGQVGYQNISWHLDKDLVIPGNKVYCKDYCVFVPSAINSLLLNCKAARGEYPVGVTYRSSVGKFIAQVQRRGRQDYLGRFETQEEAFVAYKIAKEQEVKIVAEEYRGLIDARVYTKLIEHEVKIDD